MSFMCYFRRFKLLAIFLVLNVYASWMNYLNIVEDDWVIRYAERWLGWIFFNFCQDISKIDHSVSTRTYSINSEKNNIVFQRTGILGYADTTESLLELNERLETDDSPSALVHKDLDSLQ